MSNFSESCRRLCISIFGYDPELDGEVPLEQKFPEFTGLTELDKIKKIHKARQQVAVYKFKLELMKLDYPYEGKTAREVVKEIGERYQTVKGIATAVNHVLNLQTGVELQNFTTLHGLGKLDD